MISEILCLLSIFYSFLHGIYSQALFNKCEVGTVGGGFSDEEADTLVQFWPLHARGEPHIEPLNHS